MHDIPPIPWDEEALSKPSIADDLVDIEEACRIVGGTQSPIHPSTFWRLVKSGDIPKPIHLAPQIRRWCRSELEAFVEARIAAREDDYAKGRRQA
jgi:predicted DNA-binding transcriptional regulator AlpA